LGNSSQAATPIKSLIGKHAMITDLTQLTGEYAASWLPWIMIPLIFYILPFPVIALVFLWIEKESIEEEN
jgi:photosystem I subunit VIII